MICLFLSALLILLTASSAFAWDSSLAKLGEYSCMGKSNIA
jgi:hypothetical protein